MGRTRAEDTDREQGMSRPLMGLLALTCGAAVANVYYAQPLLHTLAGAFSVSSATAGLLITVTQVGYVIGLVLLVPLGDLLERRGLIVMLLAAVAVAQAGAVVSPSFAAFAVSLGIACVGSVVAQVIVPLSSTLAAAHARGQVVGTVMSGLLVGILLARTASGLIAGILGWRTVFVFASASMLALAAVLWCALPVLRPAEELRYAELLRSVVQLIRDEPVLRQRMALGAAGFGAFSVLWTSLAFLLSGPPYDYGNVVIGLFGLAGVAGALAAPATGRIADRGRGSLVTTVTLLTLVASWGLLVAGKSSVIALIAGIAVLDFAVQGAHIGNQSVIYALRPEARSRLTTAYMVSCFAGGAACSALAAAIYSSAGWTGVCGLGAVVAALGLGTWAVTGLRMRSGRSGQELATSGVER
jgi:predicted MFS family arabinose efflux permease